MPAKHPQKPPRTLPPVRTLKAAQLHAWSKRLLSQRGGTVEERHQNLVNTILRTFQEPASWPLTDTERCRLLRELYRQARHLRLLEDLLARRPLGSLELAALLTELERADDEDEEPWPGSRRRGDEEH